MQVRRVSRRGSGNDSPNELDVITQSLPIKRAQLIMTPSVQFIVCVMLIAVVVVVIVIVVFM